MRLWPRSAFWNIWIAELYKEQGRFLKRVKRLRRSARVQTPFCPQNEHSAVLNGAERNESLMKWENLSFPLDKRRKVVYTIYSKARSNVCEGLGGTSYGHRS